MTSAAVAVVVPAVLAAAAWPRWWSQIAPEQSAMTWLQSVALAVLAVGVDSVDPATWSLEQERIQQSLEERVELASDLSLLTALLLRLTATMTADIVTVGADRGQPPIPDGTVPGRPAVRPSASS